MKKKNFSTIKLEDMVKSHRFNPSVPIDAKYVSLKSSDIKTAKSSRIDPVRHDDSINERNAIMQILIEHLPPLPKQSK